MANEEMDRRTSEQLWAHGVLLASIVESSQDAIISKDLNGVILSWNKGAECIYGYTAGEMIGSAISILIPTDRPDELPMILERVHRGEKVEHYESIRLTKDGRRLNVSLSVSPIRNRAGEVVGASTIARNITDEKLREERLRRAQKMESLGLLAGGIAHDFNNLLMVIRGNSHLIALGHPSDDRLLGMLDDIAQAVNRGASLVKQLLSFSKHQALQTKLVDVHQVLTEVANMLPRLIGPDIQLVVSQDKSLALVKADESQLFQAIVNLATNARDSMPQGGRLSIDAELVILDEYYAQQHSDVIPVAPGRYVMVAVSDSGVGIPKDIRDKMFDPFFSTKPPGKGTGLGLSVVQGIVHQCGGHISVYSEVGAGSVIKLYFPAALELNEPAALLRPTSEPGYTVLLAEDDPSVRRMLSQILVSAGYVVLQAENGVEALEIARRHREQIAALVTDIVMPQMGGIELAKQLESVCPEARIVYMSGFSENMALVNEPVRKGALFLPKPFPLREFVEKLADLIGGSPRSEMLLPPNDAAADTSHSRCA
jgi:PAS domain S-box-containing protein